MPGRDEFKRRFVRFVPACTSSEASGKRFQRIRPARLASEGAGRPRWRRLGRRGRIDCLEICLQLRRPRDCRLGDEAIITYRNWTVGWGSSCTVAPCGGPAVQLPDQLQVGKLFVACPLSREGTSSPHFSPAMETRSVSEGTGCDRVRPSLTLRVKMSICRQETPRATSKLAFRVGVRISG